MSAPRSTRSPETALMTIRPREVAFSRFQVQVLEGPNQGASALSEGTELAVGTAPGNQLVLADRTVSRHHCSIQITPEGFLLKDLGSTNGTTLGGYRIREAFLRSGAAFGVGGTSLRFEVLADEVREPISEESVDPQGRVLGASAAMRRIFAALPRVAAADATVLLEGETGTGKGAITELIHQMSPRANGPFVVIDCAAIPPTLIEAELFGHAKGAFTGAQAARAGAFEAAQGGTVMLDEIGELRLDLQPKLLRALEERQIRRLGSLEPVKLDVRVIAATNRDLRQEVNKGSFRSDLYYRLNVVRIRIPPLRERREDIPLLCAHFYRQFSRDADPTPPAELVEALMRQDWPGNVRELRGAVERAVLMGDPALWREAVLGAEAPASEDAAAAAAASATAAGEPGDLDLSFRGAKERAMARWERTYVEALVRAHGGNLSRAARAARMDRNYLRELLRRYGISASEG